MKKKKTKKIKKNSSQASKKKFISTSKGFDQTMDLSQSKNEHRSQIQKKVVARLQKKPEFKSAMNKSLTIVQRFKKSDKLAKTLLQNNENGEKLRGKLNVKFSNPAQTSNYKVSTGFSVPDFLNGQKQSFKNFLSYGLIQELNLYGWFSMRLEDISSDWAFYNPERKFIKMPLDNSIDVIFHGDQYKLIKPNLSPKKAILSRQTYSSQLYVPIQINLHWTKEVFIHWFLLANLPMMTKKGHFIINGLPRLILNQIIRRPGVYFKTIEKKTTSTYVADFIAQRGTWLRLEIVRNRRRPSTGKIWAKLNRLKKFSVSLLLSDLGLSQAFFDQYLKSTSFVSRFKDDPIFQNTFPTKINQVREFLETTKLVPWVCRLTSRQGYFRKKFSNAYFYSLSPSGRQNLNQTLGLNLPIDHLTLTGEDVLLGCCQLIDFFNGSQKPSDIDDLKNRKLRPTGELIQTQIGLGLVQLREGVIEKLNKKTDKHITLWKNRDVKQHYDERKAYIEGLISNAPVNAALKSFFATNPLSQFLDQTNPLSELTHKRRISSLGEGGIQRDTATMAVRGIHPSHYGRICPIETPEGQNAGLVNSFTAYAKLNSLGLIETPFYRVYKGMVLKEKATMFSSEQEKNFSIAPGDVSMTKDHCLVSKKQPVRQADNFNRLLPNQIDFMAIGPLQMISIATSLIPFLEHDDGNRALMGSNMQRQAVPTLIAASPIVGTGYESRVLADSCIGIQAKSCGFINYVDNQKIILYSPAVKKNKLKTFNLTRLTNPKSNEKSSRLQNKMVDLIKPIAKTNLFGHKNMHNWTDLNQMQLQQHFDLNHHNACFSLWLMFSNFAKKNCLPIPSKKGKFNSLITQTTLTLLKQTNNTNYFNHYCILLLHQIGSISEPMNPLLPLNPLQPASMVMDSKIKSNQILTLKNKIKPHYEMIKYQSNNQKPKIITTAYSKHATKQRLKATLTVQGLDSSLNLGSNYPSVNKTLKTNWSSTLLKKGLNKVMKHDLEIDSFKKPITSEKPSQTFYMGLFKKPLTLKQNSLFKQKLKQNKSNQCKPNKPVISNALLAKQYNLTAYFRSNQDTPLAQKPLVSEGQWVEKGDALADNRASLNGELAIGQNLLVGYTPWEGYNFEDAVLLNQRVISEDLLTTLHIERYEINIKDTRYGPEFIPRDGENLEPLRHNCGEDKRFSYLENGIVKVGTWVNETMLLVRKFTPVEKPSISAHEKLAQKILQTSDHGIRNTSVCVPANVHGRVIHVEIENEYNAKLNLKKANKSNQISNEKGNSTLLPKRRRFLKQRLKKQRNFAFEIKGETNSDLCKFYVQDQVTDYQNGLNFFAEKQNLFFVTKPLTTLKRLKNFATKKKPIKSTNKAAMSTTVNLNPTIRKIEIYIAEQRKVQVGDKIAGRHGNKGIISAILPREDMPYLPDGSILDVVLNPLGVPSRMNVGQIFECLLGLAGSYLNQVYKIQPFDETYGIEASRSLVYSKLYEARLKTNQSWLFNPNYPGKVRLFDGRTGQCFAQPVTVGKAYILKLIHLVDEKIHARSIGPYSIITQQPLKGRSSQGGQRVGEMEVWAFEGFGAAYILQELLTTKSDDMQYRKDIDKNIRHGLPFDHSLPESFFVLLNELKCLCLHVTINEKNILKSKHNPNLFNLKRPWPFRTKNKNLFFKKQNFSKEIFDLRSSKQKGSNFKV